jgi:hypothetical protein
MSKEPDHDLDHPPTLYEAGLLAGKAVGIDGSSIRALGRRHGIFVATRRSTDEANEARLVVVKSVVEDGTRIPRDGKREANLLAKLRHRNVRTSLLNRVHHC